MNNDLLFKFKNGDEEAFKKIVKEYKNRLFNFIYRFTQNLEDSEDLLQDLFLRIFKSRNSYKPQEKFDNFIYKIASNLCKDYYKKIKPKIGLNEEVLISDSSIPDDKLEKKELEGIVKKAILSLPYNQRIVITLLIYEDKSYAEISKITGFSIQSIKSLLFRARKNLKKILTPATFLILFRYYYKEVL